MKEYSLEDVFGNSRGIPLNYTNRESIDDLFKVSLRRRHHIVIFGSSKQGKTCLRKNHLNEEEYISIQCLNTHTIIEINEQILKKAGFKITVSEKDTKGTKLKTNLSFGAKLLTIVQGSTEIGFDKEAQKEVEFKELEIDLSDVNDIIKALADINFSKFILLEDFHYLKRDVQSEFAFTLKSYYENSPLMFIIIGVWLEENRLVALNGDLIGRVTSINADKWTSSDLENVIENGCRLLNVRFDAELKDQIIQESYDNVFFVQEICYKICESFKALKTLPLSVTPEKDPSAYYDDDGNFQGKDEEDDGRFLIPNKINIKEIIQNFVAQHSGRYNAFISQFGVGVDHDEFEIYKWLLLPILKSNGDALLSGISFSKIKELIMASHPLKTTLKLSLISKSLQNLGDFQLQKKLTPNIVDYSDRLQLLQIVDKGFIIWLGYQDKHELLTQIDLPTD